MALNKSRLNRSRRSTSRGSGGFLKLGDGKNILRIFSFEHTVRKKDFKKGFYRESDGIKVGDTFDEVDREVSRHFTDDGVINCIGSGCQYCEEADDLMASNKKRDQKAGKQLSASRSFYVNAVDIDNPDGGVQMCGLPQTVYSEVLSYLEDPEFGEDILGVDGRDFIIERDSKQLPQNMYSVKLRDEKRCEKLEGEFEVTNLFDCAALEPGWSSEESINQYETQVPEDEEDDKKDSRKSSNGKDKEENDFKDEDEKDSKSNRRRNTSGKPPWEKDDTEDAVFLEVGDIVSFDDEGETFDGYIEEINDDTAAVQTGKKSTDIFDIPLDELTLVEKAKKQKTKPKSKRRRG